LYIPGFTRLRSVGIMITHIQIMAPENGSSVGSTTNTNKFRPME